MGSYDFFTDASLAHLVKCTNLQFLKANSRRRGAPITDVGVRNHRVPESRVDRPPGVRRFDGPRSRIPRHVEKDPVRQLRRVPRVVGEISRVPREV